MKRAVLFLLSALMLLSLLPASGSAETGDPITFTESENFPMPGTKTPIPKGHPFTIDGTVRASSPLVRVDAVIRNSKGAVVQSAAQTFQKQDNVTEYRLLDPTFSSSIDCLSEKIRFDKLSAGTFTLELSADDSAGNHVTLKTARFKVSSSKTVRLLPNNLRNNYADALRFFGSTEKFLFKYKFGKGRSIKVDSKWRKKYVKSAVGVNGKKWTCHKDAVPYFEKAARYIENTYVHIGGTDFDTGAVKLSDIMTFNGSMVQRYVSTLDYISHHSFGTAVDINAKSPSFRNVLKNRDKIYREVTEHLSYNGIKTVGGKTCYDFTYTGHAERGPKNVPEPLLNYLLYELAFFRAGFSWGLYYPHTCDGMHFSLTELSPALFETGPYAMRKVFAYDDASVKPAIKQQPTDASVKAGKKATFKVSSAGYGLKYQWYYRTSETAEWQRVAKRGTSASLSVKATARMNGYQYRCLVRNAAEKVYTVTVTLKVKK